MVFKAEQSKLPTPHPRSVQHQKEKPHGSAQKYILHFNLYPSLFFKSLSFLEDTLESKYMQVLNTGGEKKKNLLYLPG